MKVIAAMTSSTATVVNVTYLKYTNVHKHGCITDITAHLQY